MLQVIHTRTGEIGVAGDSTAQKSAKNGIAGSTIGATIVVLGITLQQHAQKRMQRRLVMLLLQKIWVGAIITNGISAIHIIIHKFLQVM